MRDLMGRYWMAKTIIGIALVSILTPVAIHTQDSNTNLLKVVARSDTATVEKLLSEDADVNSKEKYGGTALMVVSQEDHTKADEREINNNDACRKKKDVEDIEKRRRENKNIIGFILYLIFLPGHIIFWIVFSIGCWIGF